MSNKVNESRPTDIMGVLRIITKHPDMELVDLASQSDGFTGFYRSKDGQAYEVTVRPAKYSQHPMIKRKTQKR